ncbi:MAG: amidase [Lacibacter sp.]
MNRRKFLRNSSLAGLTIVGAGVATSSCNTSSTEKQAAASDAFTWNETTIAEVQKQMQQGTLSSKALTQAYLDRIKAIDQNGPTLRSVIEVNPDALRDAETLDRERKAGTLRGPLHGIPILIKDNIDTADRMHTTAGSLALKDHIAKKDAFVVQQLRKAGAVILGKTNLSEWANFRSTRSSSGWSSRGGQTKNPYCLDRSPCGSSSGSGAAVAANLCVVAVGTETDGSVIAPASFCGIVGLKPTIGLVSRSGIIPISATQDTAGPMARTVTDAALLLQAMAGADKDDPVTTNPNRPAETNYTALLKKDALQGKRLGVEKSFRNGRHEAVNALYRNALQVLEQQGATLVEVELLKETAPLSAAELTVLLYEFKDGLNKYLSQVQNGVKSLEELIAFNKQNAAATMPWFQQELLEMSREKGTLADPEYKKALAHSTGAAHIIDRLLQQHRLDAIVGTSFGPAHCIDLVNGDYDPGYYFCPPAAMAGYPHLTVPMGAVQGLPVGLSFIGSAWQEAQLLAMGYAYEQATLHRKAPGFLPTLV